MKPTSPSSTITIASWEEALDYLLGLRNVEGNLLWTPRAIAGRINGSGKSVMRWSRRGATPIAVHIQNLIALARDEAACGGLGPNPEGKAS